MTEEEIYRGEKLADLLTDMQDDYKSWQQAEKEVLDAIEWRNKRAMDYAKTAVKYYTEKNEK